MIQKHSYKAYAAATQTVAKTQQVIMLYDAAIKSIKQAIEAIDQGDIEGRYNSLVKACEIIFGLQGCLDFEQGGEVSQALYDFYASADARLISVHRSNNADVCKQVLKDLKAMRDAWVEVDKIDEESSAPSAPKEEDVAAASNSDKTPPDGGVAISA